MPSVSSSPAGVVLAGDVRQLKGASPRRVLEIEIDGDADRLLDRLDGVQSASFDGHRHRLVLDADTDVRQVLVESAVRPVRSLYVALSIDAAAAGFPIRTQQELGLRTRIRRC